MRLIDAEAYKSYIRKTYCQYCDGCFDEWRRDDCWQWYAIKTLEAIPTIEAKPVVHCKDCKYNVANRQQDPLDITDYTDIVCDYFMTDGMEADDFCSKGVKIPVISMEDVPKVAKEMEK